MKITHGSGNVFIDLGFSDQEAAELTLRAKLFHCLQDAIRRSKLTQVQTAVKLGIDQPKVSNILRGKMSDFSIERITNYLLKLGYDIRIEAHPATNKTALRRITSSQRKASIRKTATA